METATPSPARHPPVDPDAQAPSNGADATIDEASGASAVRLTFWQKPFAQNVMPWISSVLLHLGILLIGLIFFKAVQIVQDRNKEQFIIPEAALTDGAQGGILHPGLGDDQSRDAGQDQVPNVDTTGVSEKKNVANLAEALGGSASDAEAIATGPLSSFNHGKPSNAEGNDSGEGGTLAPFSVPGGGSGIGAKSRFIGVGGHGNRIVFVLDATGSMFQRADAVRDQVDKAIDILRPPQSFSILFFNEYNPESPSDGLMFVTPENKRIAKLYVGRTTFHGRTDPLPALKKAFDLKPDLIYFLIDPGDFPDKKAVLDLVRLRSQAGKTKMNIIGFQSRDEENEKFLADLARETGGVYKFVTARELQEAE